MAHKSEIKGAVKVTNVTIDNIPLPMYSSYSTYNALSYSESPARIPYGNMPNIRTVPYFYVPRLKLSYKWLDMDTYSTIVQLLNRPYFIVKYYDTEKKIQVIHEMFIEPQQFPKLAAWCGFIRGRQDWEITLTGTNNEVNSTVNLTYHSNFGSDSVEQQVAMKNETVRLSYGTNFIRSGYIIDGWNTTSGQTEISEYQLGYPYVATLSQDFYANWKIQTNYVLSFDYQGGTSEAVDLPPSKTVIYNQDVGELPTAQEKTGYIFVGWFWLLNGQGGQVTTSTIYNVKSNKTVYAYWIKTN